MGGIVGSVWKEAGAVDPFGAPEYLVDDVSFRQMVGTEFLRFGYHTVENEGLILRVRLVFPIAKLITMQADTQAFIRSQYRRVTS